jgi:hypothetical protein
MPGPKRTTPDTKKWDTKTFDGSLEIAAASTARIESLNALVTVSGLPFY